MAIDTLDKLFNALANNASRLVIDKASIANQTAAGYSSLWRATGQPAQGAIPGTTPAVPTKATTGAMDFTNQTSPAQSIFGWFFGVAGNSSTNLELGDRIAHMGGLVLNVTTQQNITGLDLSTLAPPAARVGASNYSDVNWYLEVYTDGGATASNATINVTYNDGSTGNLTVVAVGGTLRASRMIPLTPLIPTADQGKYIRGINSVTLSASTGTAGSFGFTAVRPRSAMPLPVANKMETFTWEQLGTPEIANDACLFLYVLASTTSTGTVRGGGKIAHG